jgi:hypothetical protein
VARQPFSRELQLTRIIALGKRQGAPKAAPDPNLRSWSAQLIDDRKMQMASSVEAAT